MKIKFLSLNGFGSPEKDYFNVFQPVRQIDEVMTLIISLR